MTGVKNYYTRYIMKKIVKYKPDSKAYIMFIC